MAAQDPPHDDAIERLTKQLSDKIDLSVSTLAGDAVYGQVSNNMYQSPNTPYNVPSGAIGGSGYSPIGHTGLGGVTTGIDTNPWTSHLCTHDETTCILDENDDGVSFFTLKCLSCSVAFPFTPKMRSAILGTIILEFLLSGDDSDRADAIADLDAFRDSLKADRACLEATEELLGLIETKLKRDMAR